MKEQKKVEEIKQKITSDTKQQIDTMRRSHQSEKLEQENFWKQMIQDLTNKYEEKMKKQQNRHSVNLNEMEKEFQLTQEFYCQEQENLYRRSVEKEQQMLIEIQELKQSNQELREQHEAQQTLNKSHAEQRALQEKIEAELNKKCLKLQEELGEVHKTLEHRNL